MSNRKNRPDWAVLAPAAVLLAMVGATAATLATMSFDTDTVEIDDRMVTLVVDSSANDAALGVDASSAEAAPMVAGARARREEGRVAGKAALDEQIAESAGALGTVRGGDISSIGSGVASSGGSAGVAGTGARGGVGGLIGVKGHQLGAGGLGSRGVGMGGGGTAEGLGGLGSKGVGTITTSGRGAVGYGSGRGTITIRGRGSSATGYGSGTGYLGRGPGSAAVDLRGPATTIDHGVNPVELASRDKLSTFAVDVDTGSFTFARATLRDGALPHKDSVRVEEFVNALDYALEPPRKKRRPFAATVEAAPSPHDGGKHLLRVSLKGIEPTVEDVPARLTFLVDTSCSMTSRLDLVKRSLHVLTDHAGPEDSIAIATYAGSTTEVLQPTPASRGQAIHAAIDSLSSAGGTAMNDGMVLAYQMAADAFVEGAENRVIVLSDGDANIGRSSHQGILESIERHAGNGITLSTVGFGRGNYRDALMEQLADKGDGNYVYIDSIDEARKVFGDKLGGMTRTIARDVKVQVEFDEDAVLAWRLIGYENRDVADEDFRNDAVDGGEIGAGHAVTALYEVILADALDDAIATVHLRAKPPGKDAPAVEWSIRFGTEAIHAEFGDASRDLRVAWSAALFAEILRESPHVNELTYADVLALLAPVAPTDEIRGLRDMVLQAQRLAEPATVAAQAGVVPGR